MFKVLAIFALAFASANAFWTGCIGGGPLPTSVSSPACSGNSCSVTRGQVLQATVVFPANVAAPVLDITIQAFAQAGGGAIDIPVTDPNACNSLSPSCPTVVGTSYTWTINVPVPTFIPAINGWFEFSLRSGGTLVTCARATATLL